MLDAGQTTEMLRHVAATMISNRDLLTEADKMGDGDHGVGMARGFEAVADELEQTDAATPDAILRSTGTILMSSVGGAAGAVFGTLFRDGAAAIADSRTKHERVADESACGGRGV